MNHRNPDDTNHTAVPTTVARCSCGAHAEDEILTLAEVAELVRVPVTALRYWRHLGAGPHSFRIGRIVRYWRSELNAWIEKKSRIPRNRPPDRPHHEDQQEHRLP